MSSYLDKIARGENPFVKTHINELDGEVEPLYELKFGLVFYTDYPPGPKRARRVFDLYMSRYGARIRQYMPTVPGSLIEEWEPNMLPLFRDQLLPALRQKDTWGYGFDDGNALDSYLFMFHGFRPVTEKGYASFFRFEFPWNVNQTEVRQLAIEVADLVPFDSGFAGYFFKPAVEVSASYDQMYAICRRFWGIEAWNLDVTVQFVRNYYQSVNWLSLIGLSLQQRAPNAVETAKRAAQQFFESSHGLIFQASERAMLGDRNHREELTGYVALAQALLPLQVPVFGSFGGTCWDEENSFDWIRRFTHPDKM